MKGTTDLLLMLAVLSFSLNVHSADLASMSSGDIRFGIDTALFDYTGTDTLGMEVYQQFQLDQFSMDQDSVVRFMTTVVLLGDDGDTAAVDQWNTETEWVSGRSAVNSIVLPVIAGDYTLRVTVVDAGNGMQGNLERDLTIEPIGSLSDIELARALVPSPPGSSNPLRKGGLLVFPAANGTYTLPEEHMAYYYLELYDLGGETVKIQGRLETSGGEVIFARPWAPVEIPQGGDAVGLVDSLDLQTVRNSGLHRLVFGVIAEGDTLETEKFLIVGRNFEDDLAIPDSMRIVDIPFPQQFRLVLTSGEKDVFDALDQQAQNRFYSAYWQGSPEFREEFEERCAQAEQRYSTPYREGWETDRGRVYVIYGPPDDIEAVLFQGEQVPYEIWYYYGSGNERFVFADMSSTGDYEQVFSTVEGEVSYSNWERMITPISAGGGSGE